MMMMMIYIYPTFYTYGRPMEGYRSIVLRYKYREMFTFYSCPPKQTRYGISYFTTPFKSSRQHKPNDIWFWHARSDSKFDPTSRQPSDLVAP